LEMLSRMLRRAGFASVEIDIGQHSRALMDSWAPDLELERFVAAANITARKILMQAPDGSDPRHVGS
jgi:hypothetical protein